MHLIDAIRIMASLIMLGYASWVDLRTREVYDIVWAIFGGFGLMLNIWEIYHNSLTLTSFGLSLAFSSVLAFVIGYLGLYGWADALAFVTLTILHPVQPRSILPFLGIVSIIYPLSLFSNSALAGVSFAFMLFIRNVISAINSSGIFNEFADSNWKKLVVMFTGLRVKIEDVRGPPFQYPLELPTDEKKSARKFNLLPDIQDDYAAKETFVKLKDAGLTHIWVSNTLPFIVFITIGYIVTLAIGDLALTVLVRYLLS